MEIIEVSHNDIIKLLPLAEPFFAEANLLGKFNPGYFSLSLSQCILAGDGVAFALNDYSGAVAGFIYTDRATGDRVADEWFWFIRPQNRQGLLGVKLFHAFEDWAKKSGAKRIFTGSLLKRKLNTLYHRMGYTHVENRFVKEF